MWRFFQSTSKIVGGSVHEKFVGERSAKPLRTEFLQQCVLIYWISVQSWLGINVFKRLLSNCNADNRRQDVPGPPTIKSENKRSMCSKFKRSSLEVISVNLSRRIIHLKLTLQALGFCELGKEWYRTLCDRHMLPEIQISNLGTNSLGILIYAATSLADESAGFFIRQCEIRSSRSVASPTSGELKHLIASMQLS